MFDRQKYARTAWLAVAVSLLAGTLLSKAALGQPAEIDPQAGKLLNTAITYLADQQQFSLDTQNTIEDLLDSGQRVDIEVSASIVINRPDRLRAERRGEQVDQVFTYDGKELTLYNPSDNVYATVPAPATLEETLNFSRDALGLIVPASDLLYSDAYALLMDQVTSARVLEKAVINGVRCDHLAFSRPGVDFQVWVADGEQPLIYKYVVTDTATPARLSVSTVTSNWAVGTAVGGVNFSFTAPPEAKPISFMRLDTDSATNR